MLVESLVEASQISSVSWQPPKNRKAGTCASASPWTFLTLKSLSVRAVVDVMSLFLTLASGSSASPRMGINMSVTHDGMLTLHPSGVPTSLSSSLLASSILVMIVFSLTSLLHPEAAQQTTATSLSAHLRGELVTLLFRERAQMAFAWMGVASSLSYASDKAESVPMLLHVSFRRALISEFLDPASVCLLYLPS